jgi:hypothetical protein
VSTQPRWRPHTHAGGGAKVRHATQAEAVAAAHALRDADLLNGMAFRRWPAPYPCSDSACGGWHVGNWSDRAYRSRPA